MTPEVDSSDSARTELLPELPVTYQTALGAYLAHPDESTLHQASELGRAAMNAGLGVVELIRLHHRALADGVLPGEGVTAVYFAPALEAFLVEALSPFEAACRGFHRARERLQQINGVLAERNEELAQSNAQLEEEIKVRQKVESALRESKDHYFKLFRQAHAMETDLRELSARVLSAQEEERKRISRELHDEIGQALTSVNVAIAMLKKQARSDEAFERRVAEAEQLLAQSMEMVHCFARELRPAMLDHLGLHSALRDNVGAFTRRTGIKTELIAHPDLARVTGPRSEVIFRVVQEALNNVFKHARATEVKIEFSSADDMLSVVISDNGCAFCVEEKLGARPTGRLGLLGMQERVRYINGVFAVESVQGKGTCVRVQIPMDAQPRHAALAEASDANHVTPVPGCSSLYENHIRAAC